MSEARSLSQYCSVSKAVRPTPSGRITVLIDSFDGKKLNAPNDVVVASDGAVWFTDPGYGILGNYEGHKDTSEQPPRVYRLEMPSGRAKVVADGFDKPNGIALSPTRRSCT